MTVEHLLLALLDNPSAGEALNACGVDMGALKVELSEFIDETTPVIPDLEEDEKPANVGFSASITARCISCAIIRQK